MEGTGGPGVTFTTTTADAGDEQPLASVNTTVYDPDVFTVMDDPLAPFDQR
jgi:hypothetical protein